VFTTPDRQPLHPGLPDPPVPIAGRGVRAAPVRLHDLRHGAASLAHSVGADLKTVQEQFGRSSIVLTADTYTSVLTDKHHKTTEATARLVLAVAARGPRRRKRPTPARRRSPLPPSPRRGRSQYGRRHPDDERQEAGVAPTGHPSDTNGPQATDLGDECPAQRVRRQGLEPPNPRIKTRGPPPKRKHSRSRCPRRGWGEAMVGCEGVMVWVGLVRCAWVVVASRGCR